MPLLVVLLLGSTYTVAAVVAPKFDPTCLPWSAAHYRAQKLFMSVDLEVAARMLEEPPLATLRPVEGRAALTPHGPTLELRVTTRGPGWRTLEGELLLDAPTGRILQYASLRTPAPRYRVYRFTGSGPERWTAKPGDGESEAAPERWSDIDIRQRTYPAGAVEGPVLEVSTLLYLLAASPLAAEGDVLQVNGYATSADELYQVSATVGRPVRLAVDYRVTGAGAPPSRRGVTDVLPIRVTGRIEAASGADIGGQGEGLEILGLQDVEFLLDPEQRVIAALRARIPAVGGVQFQLQALGLKDGLPARCR